MSENRKKYTVLALSILGVLLVLIGTSFAAFSVTLSGKKNQAINTGCLKVEMTDNGSLSLSDSYPLSDEEGMQIDPYTFTIENVCSIDAYYETTINVMNGSNLDNISKIKLAMDGDTNVEPIKESSLPQTTLVDSVTGVERTYKIDEGFLKVGEEKTFNLREWIDYDVEQMTGTLENKVIINSEAKANGTVVYNTKTSGYYALKKSNILKNVRYKEAADKSGIVEVKEGDNVTYHYRGNPNNYLSYGTYNSTLNSNSEGDTIKWRILSSNSDGSLNLISDEVIGSSSYTNVQTLLNSFYTTHLEDEESYIKTESTFCKEGATNSEYLAKLRTENSNPTSECNGTSITKIGLPTVDDLMYAGNIYNTVTESYLNSSSSYLTNSLESASNVYVLNQNKIDKVSTSTSAGVRAVITLDSDVKLSGLGTESKPFYVTGLSDSVDIKDERAPEILYARVDERWENENKKIEISARDDNSIGGYFVSTTNEKPDKDASGWEASESSKYKTIETYDNGTYYVYVKDEAGNISEAKEVTIDKVDKVAPTCTIRVNSEEEIMNYKTLTVQTEDNDIDLNGYSWEHSDENTSIVKVDESDVYRAHLTDLAGNQGTCSVTVNGFDGEYDVHVIVNNGVISDLSTKYTKPGKSLSFNLTPDENEYTGIVNCTNGQNGIIDDNVLTVSNVTSSTTCTVTFGASATVLYNDGTFIINEHFIDRSSNITKHGAITNEYPALSNSNAYIYSNYTSRPWHEQRESVIAVEIGQVIKPTSTQYWFDGFYYMTTGNYTNLDTSNVTSMLSMFDHAGSDSNVLSFGLTGLNNWDTSKVTNMKAMFANAGYRATTWSIGNLSSWDTSSVTNMYDMFSWAGEATTTWNIGNLSNWNVSKVIDMGHMFDYAGRNSTIWNIGSLSSWNTSAVTKMNSMFYGAGYYATTLNIGNLSNWDTSQVTTMERMFGQAGCSNKNLNIGDLSSWDTSKVTNMNEMFDSAGLNSSIGILKVYATNIKYIFWSSSKAKATLNIYSNPTNYSYAFGSAATASGALITVNYSSVTTNIDNIIATKSSNSNVVKGSLLS